MFRSFGGATLSSSEVQRVGVVLKLYRLSGTTSAWPGWPGWPGWRHLTMGRMAWHGEARAMQTKFGFRPEDPLLASENRHGFASCLVLGSHIWVMSWMLLC